MLLHDVDEKMKIVFENGELPPYVPVRDLLYADDTLLMSSSREVLREHLKAVIDIGKNSA